MKKTNGNSKPKRGEVYWVNFEPTQGSEIKKIRPAVILSNDLFNSHLPRLIVVPVTSNVRKIYIFDAEVKISQKRGKAMLDQIRAIDKSRLGKKICHLTFEEMVNIECALKAVFSLN